MLASAAHFKILETFNIDLYVHRDVFHNVTKFSGCMNATPWTLYLGTCRDGGSSPKESIDSDSWSDRDREIAGKKWPSSWLASD